MLAISNHYLDYLLNRRRPKYTRRTGSIIIFVVIVWIHVVEAFVVVVAVHQVETLFQCAWRLGLVLLAWNVRREAAHLADR